LSLKLSASNFYLRILRNVLIICGDIALMVLSFETVCAYNGYIVLGDKDNSISFRFGIIVSLFT